MEIPQLASGPAGVERAAGTLVQGSLPCAWWECLQGLGLAAGTVSEVRSEEGQSLSPNQSSLQKLWRAFW